MSMASQTLRQRPKDNNGPDIPSDAQPVKDNRAQKLAMARKGLRSLIVAIAVPLALTGLSAHLSGSSVTGLGTKPTWRPPVWAFHLASASTASLMGLSAWLVWAEGAFHRQPAILGLYLVQLFLGLLWSPLVFGLGAVRIGLGLCVGLFGVMFMCAQCFRKVNPIAGDMVKPCLAWVSFLAVFNYKLVV
ncbi:uncharacterized protein A4U43_C08F31550 [Asparagus officinalis]|uniref:translocator protein homolog n=1 Tax=Asparagus officinalis TaxID=4686 RepID=UPI00098E80D2|nr:translocator protein homolog [Asparagus officinalis]ONK61590.1 uncharacterized protein A4U43_C08F31550 [Asparagus officinalis]